LLNWIARANRSWFNQLPIRIRNEKDGQIYVIWFAKISRCNVQVMKIEKGGNQDVLYNWPGELKYNKIKAKDIFNAMCSMCCLDV